MNAITQTAATAGQIKQINRFGSDAIEKVLAELGLDNPGAQRVIEHGDEFAAAIREAAITSLKDLSVTDKYKDEEVESSYVYPNGFKPKGLTEQTNRLRELFPGIGFANEKLAEGQLPQHAEGWFAIPKWQTLGATYQEALEKVLAKIAETRTDGFYNYREGELGPDYLRQTERTKVAFEKLAGEQEGFDILVVPAQFGLRHRGRSVRRAREVFQANEFGFGAFAIAIMVLLHPERFVKYEDLGTDCAGDEYAPGADGGFSCAPHFHWYDGKLEFGASWTGDARGSFGSVSGFGSQQ